MEIQRGCDDVMGMEVTIDSLEDMCSLMCDNRIPKKERKNDTRANHVSIGTKARIKERIHPQTVGRETSKV